MAQIFGGIDTEILATELKVFFAGELPTSVAGVGDDLDDWIDQNEERLGDWLDTLMDRLGAWVDVVSDQLSDQDADALGDWLDTLEADLENFIDEGLDALDDLIDGTEDADEILSGDGDDSVYGARGNDMIRGDLGDDTLVGGHGNDRLIGGADRDMLKGSAGHDKLAGGTGNDVLIGGGGRDVLTGGAGKDILKGGAGADRFDFNSIRDSKLGSKRDVVHFDDDDLIDLKGIDADMFESGNQAFEWIGQTAFSGDAGELRYKNGVLSGDVDGDGRADFQIAIRGDLLLDDILM